VYFFFSSLFFSVLFWWRYAGVTWRYGVTRYVTRYARYVMRRYARYVSVFFRYAFPVSFQPPPLPVTPLALGIGRFLALTLRLPPAP